MGVYIKDIEMPISCAFCKLKRRNGKKMVCPLLNEEWDIHDPMSADHRLDICPLVPVPPHGRLIDADYLLAMVEGYIEEYDATDSYGLHTDKWCGWKEAEDVIRTAKTVIEAEE